MTHIRRLSSVLRFALSYALATFPIFVFWEVAHAPLYSLWIELGAAASFKAALHYAFGDVLIAFGCALAGMGGAAWMPTLRTQLRVSGLIIVFGLLTTMLIEFVSTRWLGRWAYRDSMPVDPIFGIGMSPLAQWLVVPAIALLLLGHRLQQVLSRWPLAPEGT